MCKPAVTVDPNVSTTLFVTVPNVAETISHPVTVEVVENPNEALGAPAAILTDAGTVNPVFVDFKVTVVALVTGAWRAAVQVPDPPG